MNELIENAKKVTNDEKHPQYKKTWGEKCQTDKKVAIN